MSEAVRISLLAAFLETLIIGWVFFLVWVFGG